MSATTRMAAFTGLAAGIAMMGYLVVGAIRTGLGWDSPIRWMIALLGNEPALIWAGAAAGAVSTTTCIVLGLSIHLLTAIALARIFFILAGQLQKLYLPFAGAAYGVVIWAVMTFGLLRALDDVMYTRVRLMPLTFLAAHLVYGSTVGVAYSMLRRSGSAYPPEERAK